MAGVLEDQEDVAQHTRRPQTETHGQERPLEQPVDGDTAARNGGYVNLLQRMGVILSWIAEFSYFLSSTEAVFTCTQAVYSFDGEINGWCSGNQRMLPQHTRRPQTEHKLILIKENLTWSEALRYCRQNHVDLVLVQSEEMQREVMNVVKRASTAEVWLGLHNYCIMNIWLWLSGEVVCYQNWAPGNGMTPENCKLENRKGAVQSGGDQRWISLPESHKLNFICSRY
ncbi:hypothetical protein cypCar_00043216 [Cyprinus carpio]|nr:hypothetical protein cypCar_00043216 [Cyprinus carpio]